jgi:hypothetical protein
MFIPMLNRYVVDEKFMYLCILHPFLYYSNSNSRTQALFNLILKNKVFNIQSLEFKQSILKNLGARGKDRGQKEILSALQHIYLSLGPKGACLNSIFALNAKIYFF